MSRLPKDVVKVRSRFKVGDEVLIRVKITKITEGVSKADEPTLVVVPPKAMAPIRVAESDVEPDR